ncbi:unknown [Anaerotruncus sp. CAG:390]|nr:unknown [Anaerotruncus sp. CAG:390]
MRAVHHRYRYGTVLPLHLADRRRRVYRQRGEHELRRAVFGGRAAVKLELGEDQCRKRLGRYRCAVGNKIEIAVVEVVGAVNAAVARVFRSCTGKKLTARVVGVGIFFNGAAVVCHYALCGYRGVYVHEHLEGIAGEMPCHAGVENKGAVAHFAGYAGYRVVDHVVKAEVLCHQLVHLKRRNALFGSDSAVYFSRAVYLVSVFVRKDAAYRRFAASEPSRYRNVHKFPPSVFGDRYFSYFILIIIYSNICFVNPPRCSGKHICHY